MPGLGTLPLREFVARRYGVDMTVGDIATILEVEPEVIMHHRPPAPRHDFFIAPDVRRATLWDAY